MKHRPTLIWAGLVLVLGTASGLTWVAVFGTFRPAWWWVVTISTLIGLAADAAERAITRRLETSRRARRRAHARRRPRLSKQTTEGEV
ncbi:hypothetical protein [Streptomyces sp. NPDC001658]